MMTPMIWINGQLVPADTPVLSAADRGFLLGDGLFETLAIRGGKPVDLEEHLVRLTGGADALGIPFRFGAEPLRAEVSSLLAANGVEGDGVLRITLSRGPGSRGLRVPEPASPVLVLTAEPYDFVEPTPRRVVVSTVVRHPGAVTSRWKTVSYLDQVMALREAEARGFDDALMPNGLRGFAGASHANLFVVVQGRVHTPRIEDGALPGITRGQVLARLAEEGVEVVQSSVPWSGVARASEVFLTNSLAGVIPVASAEDTVYAAPGPITARLCAWWNDREE